MPDEKLPPEVPGDDPALNMTTEQINALLAAANIPAGETRPAVLAEWNGVGDEGILAGGVTAAEAYLLFKKHYEEDPNHKAIGTHVARISPAVIMGRKVWLPDLSGADAARKHWRNQSSHLTRQVEILENQLRVARDTAHELYTNLNKHIMALAFVMFDHLEGRDSPMRDEMRRQYADHPDTPATPEEIDRLIIKAAERLGDWARRNAA